jgi:hypothetical protein
LQERGKVVDHATRRAPANARSLLRRPAHGGAFDVEQLTDRANASPGISMAKRLFVTAITSQQQKCL